MAVITRQTRRPARRADENAPPTNGATSTRSRTTVDPIISTKPTITTSSLPVMKRQSSSTSVIPNGKPVPLTKRSALGEVTNAGKNIEKPGLKPERKPLVSTNSSQQVPRRTRSSLVGEVKKEAPVAAKRKAVAPTKLAAATTLPLKGKVLNVKAEIGAEPSRKRRKTSTPPLVEDLEDLGDEGLYDEDGREILLSSGGRATGQKSPKPSTVAKDEGWTDLDAEDEGDPGMVSEYVVDAFDYMLAIEVSDHSSSTCLEHH